MLLDRKTNDSDNDNDSDIFKSCEFCATVSVRLDENELM